MGKMQALSMPASLFRRRSSCGSAMVVRGAISAVPVPAFQRRRHTGKPSYGIGAQGQPTWAKPCGSRSDSLFDRLAQSEARSYAISSWADLAVKWKSAAACILSIALLEAAVRTGPDWVMETAAAQWQARDSQGELVFDNRLWIFGGWFNSFEAPPRDVWSSRDGKTWNLVT